MQCSLPLALRLKISQLSAGSIAASIQSGIRNVAAESACTALQSAGMYRALNAIGVTAGTVSTAAGAVALGELVRATKVFTGRRRGYSTGGSGSRFQFFFW